MVDTIGAESSAQPLPPLSRAAWIWFRIGVLSFGGPAAQIALMHRMLVDELRWLKDRTFLDALSFCMLLPGPEAMQLATYAGWRLHGWRGGLTAGLLFVLPGAVLVLMLAVLYGYHGDVPLVDSLFFGIKAAVIVIVVQALIRIAARALTDPLHRVLSMSAFVGIFFLDVPFPWIVLSAGLVGVLWTASTDRPGHATGSGVATGSPERSDEVALSSGHSRQASVSWRDRLLGTAATVALWSLLWWLPLIVLVLYHADERLLSIGRFFSTLSLVSFGGAYAALAYLAQDVVSLHGWLTTTEMMDGLALAETTPGPLILVTEFVGYLAAFRGDDWVAGVQGAFITLWVTFVPCFLWIFAGAPYLEWICAQPRLRSALSAITAAVAGVMLNLSLWFALHVLFSDVQRVHLGPLSFSWPEASTLDWRAVVLVGIGAVLVFRLEWSVLRLLAVLSLVGVPMSIL